MAKQFNVPPVIFPSGNNPNPNLTAQRNRPATAPFQPPRSTPSSLPFMSFDIGTVATSLPPPLYGASTAVIGGGFDDEPPLLEELDYTCHDLYNGFVGYGLSGWDDTGTDDKSKTLEQMTKSLVYCFVDHMRWLSYGHCWIICFGFFGCGLRRSDAIETDGNKVNQVVNFC
ncbi:hypothetical protein AgCh_017763 [Apium graveolens]